MRITIVGPAYPLRGGIAQHVYLLYKHLIGRGHQLQIISYSRLYPAFLFPGRTSTDTSSLKLDCNANPLIDTLNPLTWIKAYRQVRAFRPDLILLQWWNPIAGPVLGVLAGLFKPARLKPVIECHNVFPHEASPLDLPLTAFAFMSVTDFIVHSSADRSVLLESFVGKSVEVAPLPPPSGILELSSSPRTGCNILFFGLVRQYKGLEVLLTAMPKVLSQIDCKLHISGEFYDADSKYRHLIDALGIADRVEVDARYIPNEEIPSLFERADVLVLPYLTATQSAVANLALRSALPMIASNTGGLSEVIADNKTGLLVKPGDSDDLANALIAYFKNGLGPVFSENIKSGQNDTQEIRLITVIESLAGC